MLSTTPFSCLKMQENFNSQTPLQLGWDNDYISTNREVKKSLLFLACSPCFFPSHGEPHSENLRWKKHKIGISETSEALWQRL